MYAGVTIVRKLEAVRAYLERHGAHDYANTVIEAIAEIELLTEAAIILGRQWRQERGNNDDFGLSREEVLKATDALAKTIQETKGE